MNINCPNCPNCPICHNWNVGSFQPLTSSPRPVLSCLPPCAARRLLPSRTAVSKLPSAMGNGEPSLNCLLPSQVFSTSRMKKRLRLWLTKLINLLVYANYIDIKWRVKNYRNLKKITKSSRRNSKCASLFARLLILCYSLTLYPPSHGLNDART